MLGQPSGSHIDDEPLIGKQQIGQAIAVDVSDDLGDQINL